MTCVYIYIYIYAATYLHGMHVESKRPIHNITNSFVLHLTKTYKSLGFLMEGGGGGGGGSEGLLQHMQGA